MIFLLQLFKTNTNIYLFKCKYVKQLYKLMSYPVLALTKC